MFRKVNKKFIPFFGHWYDPKKNPPPDPGLNKYDYYIVTPLFGERSHPAEYHHTTVRGKDVFRWETCYGRIDTPPVAYTPFPQKDFMAQEEAQRLWREEQAKNPPKTLGELWKENGVDV